jgi:PKD repeat protein
MMKRTIKRSIFAAFALTTALALSFSSCKKEEPTLGNPPTAADAMFTYQPSAANANIIEFTANNQSLQATWDFGNGATGSGGKVTAIYPFAGTYSVKLTVQNSGGSTSSTQDIVIAQDDPSLISNPLYTLLTGGTSKTWAIDSVAVGHFGVGPNPSSALGDVPEYYAAQSLEKIGSGMYNDKYTFHIQGFGFDLITNGDVYVNSAHAGEPPFTDTAASPVGDFIAQHPNQLGLTWLLTEGAENTITLSGTGMMAYWTGTRTYKIVQLDTNILVLRWLDTKNPALAWYATFRPEGYSSAPPPPPTTFTLPMDFEVVQPEFTTFGNSTYAFIANPDASGINTSGNVLETVHGSETWAGLFVNLTNKLNFSTQTSIKLKVWAPATGPFRLKLEERANTNNFVEVDVNVTTANAWQEITFDMTGTAADFDRLVIFPGWGVANAGTFYIDDIKQQ